MTKVELTERQRMFLKDARLQLCNAQTDLLTEAGRTAWGMISVNKELYDKIEKINSDIEHLLGY